MVHSFGRAELVDRAALARLVTSISRFLTPEEAVAAASWAEIEVLDSRPMGGAWVLDRLWERLGVAAAAGAPLPAASSMPIWLSGCCSRWSRSGR